MLDSLKHDAYARPGFRGRENVYSWAGINQFSIPGCKCCREGSSKFFQKPLNVKQLTANQTTGVSIVSALASTAHSDQEVTPPPLPPLYPSFTDLLIDSLVAGSAISITGTRSTSYYTDDHSFRLTFNFRPISLVTTLVQLLRHPITQKQQKFQARFFQAEELEMQLAEHMAEQAQGTQAEAKEAAFVKEAEKKEKKEAGGSQPRSSVPETAGGRYATLAPDF